MSEWKLVKLSDIGEIVGGATPPTSHDEYYNGDIPWLTPKDLAGYKERYISQGERNITKLGLEKCSAKMMPKHTILFTSRAPIGYIAIAQNPICTNQGFKSIIPNDKIDYLFLYYLMKYNKIHIESMASGTTFKEVSGATMKNIEVRIPDKVSQQKIASILSSLDSKIELNNKINENLEQQVTALFHQIFDESNSNRKHISANEYFDISIGKTPPRKESRWFSKNPSDCVWVSISDMGSCGLYIADSSEYITHEAVEKFNVKIVPDNTVILSFKLTVGRIAITDGCMTTNEAIAHFKTNEPRINEYLYCYLKNFNFQTMGSTSSIATAVNSKIIKGMPFIVPTDDELEKFHKIAGPLFMMIKSNQRENKYLGELRDVLLPKLMSGEINMEDIEV